MGVVVNHFLQHHHLIIRTEPPSQTVFCNRYKNEVESGCTAPDPLHRTAAMENGSRVRYNENREILPPKEGFLQL